MAEEQTSQKPRISLLMAGLLIGTALLFDAVQFFISMAAVVLLPLLVLSWFVSGFAFMAFLIGFKLIDPTLNYLDRNASTKLFIGIASLVTELMPLVNMLPAITLGVLSLIAVYRMEDGHIGLAKRATRRESKMSAEKKKSEKIGQRNDSQKTRRAWLLSVLKTKTRGSGVPLQNGVWMNF